MNAQSVLEAGSYEQTLLRIVRSLPTYQRAQLLDVAVLLEKRRISVSTELPIDDFGPSEERLWGRLATRPRQVLGYTGGGRGMGVFELV